MGYGRVPERSAACPEDLSRPESVSLFALQFMYTVALTLAVCGVPVTSWSSQHFEVEVTNTQICLLGPLLWEQKVLSPH